MFSEVGIFLWERLIPDIFSRFYEILSAPFKYKEMFWILLPLIITWVIVEMYFARYHRERLEYHSALDNSLFLIFVGVDLIRRLFNQGLLFEDWLRTIIASIVFLMALVLGYLDFFHKMKKQTINRVNSKFVTSFIAYIGIILVYSTILSESTFYNYGVTVVGLLLFYLVTKMIVDSLRTLEPSVVDDVDQVMHDVEEDLEKMATDLKKEK